tara:strand:+ start:11681 stop:12976 length:1296 start_codon:yes stop_codon:yes gene_type:complete
MEDYNTLNVPELRATVRTLIKEGKLHGMSASNTAMLNKKQCLDAISASAMGEPYVAERTTSEAVSSHLSRKEALMKELAEVIASEEEQPASVDMEEVKKEINKAVSTVANKVDKMEELLEDALATPKTLKRVAVHAKAKAGKNAIVTECLRFYKAGEANDTKLMLLSPPSFGKSHAVREVGQTYDLFLEHGCSRAIDEIDRLEGSPSPDSEKGGFVTPDGKLAQAVREASSGKTVLLFLDEVLRWSENTQAFLLTFLQGVKKSSGTVYSLTTKKTEKGNLEVIECPTENLHIICGANLTAEQPIGAFWSRFRKYRIEFSEAIAEQICNAIMESYKVDPKGLKTFCKAFAKAMSKTRDLQKSGAIFVAWDFRNLEDALRVSRDVRGIAQEIASLTPSHSCLWDMDTGDYVPDSIASHAKICEEFTNNVTAGV